MTVSSIHPYDGETRAWSVATSANVHGKRPTGEEDSLCRGVQKEYCDFMAKARKEFVFIMTQVRDEGQDNSNSVRHSAGVPTWRRREGLKCWDISGYPVQRSQDGKVELQSW